MFELKTAIQVGKLKQHVLALTDIMLPGELIVGKQVTRKKIEYLGHHEVLIVEKQQGLSEEKIIDISYFCPVAYVVLGDILMRRYWVMDEVDIVKYNNVKNRAA